MNAKLSKILDESIKKLIKGETIQSCLEEYPDVRVQLEPLLNTAQLISAIPKVSVSDEYRRVSKARLIARIRRESTQEREAKARPSIDLLDELGLSWRRMWQALYGARKVAIPVTLVLVLAFVLSFSGLFNYLSPTPALASQCTLSVLSGSVEIQKLGSSSTQPGNDGMTLNVGTRVKTASESHALLTFFEGSTIKIEPGSDVEIQQIVFAEEQATTIVLKQWLGRTWSRVVKMTDPGSHYQIETPSATAIVRGTMFATEVGATGSTKVTTKEGLVSVIAQGEEVYLPADQQTQVDTGEIPSQPQTAPPPKSEIIITIAMPAVGSITDPSGSSTGILSTGFSYNQILGSHSSAPSEDKQLINIVEPAAGEYVVALRYITEGVSHFSIEGKHEGEVVFNYEGNWSAQEAGGWLMHLDLQVDDGKITGGEIVTVETLGENSPENVIGTEIADDKGASIDSLTGDSDDGDNGKPEDQGKPDKPEDNGKPEDKGKPDKPEDNGKPEDKGASIDSITGDSDDGDNGKPEDKGNPDKPEDNGKPEDQGNPDKPEDNGKPEDQGNPDEPEDNGKPEDQGNPDEPEDNGKPEDKGKPEDQGNDRDKKPWWYS